MQNVQQVIPDTLAWEYQAVPVAFTEDTLVIGLVPPRTEAAEMALSVNWTGRITWCELTEKAFVAQFAATYPESILLPHKEVPKQDTVWEIVSDGFRRASESIVGQVIAFFFLLWGIVMAFKFFQIIMLMAIEAILGPLRWIVIGLAAALIYVVVLRHRASGAGVDDK